MPRVQYIAVTPEESGQKLVSFLQRRLQEAIPRSALMRWVRTGQVRLDNARCKPFVRVQQGQVIRIPPYRIQEQEHILHPLQEKNPFCLRRVYEDHRLLVLAKPPNLAVQPGSSLTDSVVHRIRRMYMHSSWLPSLVHRLDRQTSGLLLLAKDYEYLQYLHRLWAQGLICKVYLAWVAQKTSWPSWNKLQDKLEIVARGESLPRHQQAVSYVRTLRNSPQGSLLAVRLVTGRKHQIRIQLARRGLPVIGDRKYQGSTSSQGLMLHACHLSWPEHCFNLEPPWLQEYQVCDLSDLGLTQDLPVLGRNR